MIILDTSVLLAFLWAADPSHEQVAAFMDAESGPFIVSPYVVAELDYLLLSKGGVRAELIALDALSGGAYELPLMGSADVASCMGLLIRYADHRVGVTDASLVVLADRYGTNRIATFDHRHFSVLRALDGSPFTLVPA